MTRLWIRVDGSASMGLGHVMRTIALAQAARRANVGTGFVMTRDPVADALPKRFGFGVDLLDDAMDVSWLERVSPDDAVYIDGYHFGDEFQRHVLVATPRLGVMTDLTSGRFAAPLVVNQNPLESDAGYDCEPDTQVLLGPRYALIREEFLPLRRPRSGGASRALVTMGGSDVAGLGAEVAVLTASHLPSLEVVLVCGPAAPPVEADEIKVVRDPADVPSIFASADLAISAAGTTTWELLYLGIPLALVQVADNQSSIGPAVQEAGAGLFLGAADEAIEHLDEALEQLVTPACRAELEAAAVEMVDGKGADRVLEALLVTPVRR